jgi:DNA-binding CsgD family transcriptional regulator
LFAVHLIAMGVCCQKMCARENGPHEERSKMTLDERQTEARQATPRTELSSQRTTQLQSKLAAAAKAVVMDELGSAVSDRFNEPLTALLRYLRLIERTSRTNGSMQRSSAFDDDIIAAIREANRLCTILEQVRAGYPEPIGRSEGAFTDDRNDPVATPTATYGNGSAREQQKSIPVHSRQSLTVREREVLAQITAGSSNKEGSLFLRISTRTFEVHRAHIMRKFGARNAADLVRVALSRSQQD